MLSAPSLSVLRPKILLQIARKTGFVLRSPRKLHPFAFLGSCLLSLNSGSPHLRFQSIFAGLLAQTTLSKQALHQRMGDASCRFMEAVLAYLFSRQISVKNISHSFGRILIADSTCVSLPQSHRTLFPGPSNASVDGACVRIQGLFELISEQFLDFKITPFTRNDQAASGDLLPFLKPRDLVLRDLGYFSLKTFAAIEEMGAFFLSRWRYATCLLDPTTKKPINLLELLKQQGSLDIPVFIGKEHTLPVRLVALPLPPQVADAKRRKANQDRDRRVNHSKEYMALLSWNIFITNANSKILPVEKISIFYSMRWRVETIFKSWKSHLHLNSLSLVGKRQIKTLLCAHLIHSVLLHQSMPPSHINNPIAGSLSLIKLAQFYAWILPILLLSSFNLIQTSLCFLPQINRHCSYEKRKRKNFLNQKISCLS